MTRSHPWLRATRRQLVILIVIVLIGAFGAAYLSRVWQLQAVEAELRQWQATVTAAEAHTQRLQAELARIQSPAYLEEQARDALGLARPGDILVVPVLAPTPTPLATPAPQPTPVRSPWQRLLDTLLGRTP